MSEVKAVPSLMLLVIAGCALHALGNVPDEPPTQMFQAYSEAVAAGKASEAVALGQTIYEAISRAYREDPGFGAFHAKLMAADFLTGQMVTQLKKATGKQVGVIAGEVLGRRQGGQSVSKAIAIAPAHSFYRTSQTTFTRSVEIAKLSPDAKAFLATYYNMRLKSHIQDIAQAGQALAIAEPSFNGTHDYVLVLPLLHVSKGSPLDTGILPGWLRQPDQLAVFADSCLLHFGLPFQAMTIAGEGARVQGKSFSPEAYYQGAARKCGTEFAHLGVECLERAYEGIKDARVDDRVRLQLDIVQIWLDAQSYKLAAGRAHEIVQAFPEHASAGKATWLYHYSLSRAGNTQEILQNIDGALDDPRCADFHTNLLYIKWWALRRTPGEEGRVLAVEHQLISQNGESPIVAPIMLSRATDSLAKQDYGTAYALLRDLVDRFPATTAAQQAGKMIEKLKGVTGI